MAGHAMAPSLTIFYILAADFVISFDHTATARPGNACLPVAESGLNSAGIKVGGMK
jgi:hypothetical protein